MIENQNTQLKQPDSEEVLDTASCYAGRCGCGRPETYVIKGVGACNKYRRCPSYEELIESEKKMLVYKKTLEQIRDVDAMYYEYRTWAKTALH